MEVEIDMAVSWTMPWMAAEKEEYQIGHALRASIGRDE